MTKRLYDLDWIYVGRFIFFIVGISISTLLLFYVFIVDWKSDWIEDFQTIKTALVKYGIISHNEEGNFSIQNLTDVNNNSTLFAPYQKRIKEIQTNFCSDSIFNLMHLSNISNFDTAAIKVSLPSCGDIFTRHIAPLLIVIGSFFFVALRFRLPGINKLKNASRQFTQPEKRIEFIQGLNQSIIIVSGWIIGLLGGFLLTSGLNNFYFVQGYEIIILSLIFALGAHAFLISSIKREQKNSSNDLNLSQESIEYFFKFFYVSFWLLILGLIMLGVSLS